MLPDREIRYFGRSYTAGSAGGISVLTPVDVQAPPPLLGAIGANGSTHSSLFGSSPLPSIKRRTQRRRIIEAKHLAKNTGEWVPKSKQDLAWAKKIECYDGTRRLPPPEVIAALPQETSFRHSGWEQRRQQMRIAMIAAGTTGRVIQCFDSCGANAWVEEYTDDDGGFRLKAQYCKQRWCKPCQKARALLIADNLRRKLTDTAALHIVLTVRHYPGNLPDQVTQLYTWFKQLRNKRIWLGRRVLFPARMPTQCNTPARKKRWQAARHALTFRWRNHTSGGATFFQTHVGQDGLWHNHFHSVAAGKWMPQRQLGKAWCKITGGSTDVSVTAVTGTDRIVGEVTRYAARPVDDDKVQDIHKLSELIIGLRGRHLCFAWGKWRGFQLTNPPDPSTRPTRPVGRLIDILAKAEQGQIHARIILDILATKSCASQAPPEDEHYL